jgi:hypothetical protein
MGTAAVGVAQKEDDEPGIDEQDICDGVVLFLAALTHALRGTVKVFLQFFKMPLPDFGSARSHESREMLGAMPPQASPPPQGRCPDTSA